MFWEQNLRIYRRLLYDDDVFCNVGAYAQRKEVLMNLRLQCIEDFGAQINLYMLFNQHDFTATLCISLTSQDYFWNTISEIVPITS